MMKNFSLYDATGRIVISGTVHQDDFEAQAQPGLTLIEGGDWKTHKVVDGVLTPLSPEEYAEVNTSPLARHFAALGL